MKALVIGCGSIGARHARNLSRMGSVDVMVTDSDETRSSTLADQVGGRAVADLDQGLAYQPDAVLVCVPNHLHVEFATKALSVGAHVFIEKPISHTTEGIDDLVALARSSNRVVLVACNMRFHKPVATMKRWLNEGRIGSPLFGRFRFGNFLGNWRPDQDYRQTYSARSDWGGGVVLDAIHEIDYARWFMGEPESVSAVTGKVSDLEIDTEEVAELTIRFSSKAIGQIHLDYLRPVRARSCEIVGDEGMMVWEAVGKAPETSTLELYVPGGSRLESLAFSQDLNQAYVDQTVHFLRCVNGEESPAQDASEAKRVLEIALAAVESQKLSRSVQVGRYENVS